MTLKIASYIDHTLLKAITTGADIERLCAEAAEQQFAAVCVPPYYVAAAKKLLDGTKVKVATVAGFPFGYGTTHAKVMEIKDVLKAGADEVDMVHNLAALKNDDWGYLEKEIAACIEPIHKEGKIIKVIIESGLLTEAEIVKCCVLYKKAGVDFLKTSTGYAQAGASLHAVKVMRQHLPASIGIKASGGIRTFAFAKELIDAGASRIGSSSSMIIIKGSKVKAKK